MQLSSDPRPRGPRHWLKRLGAIGFLFFLVKGLLWLLVPLFLMFWGFLGF